MMKKNISMMAGIGFGLLCVTAGTFLLLDNKPEPEFKPSEGIVLETDTWAEATPEAIAVTPEAVKKDKPKNEVTGTKKDKTQKTVKKTKTTVTTNLTEPKSKPTKPKKSTSTKKKSTSTSNAGKTYDPVFGWIETGNTNQDTVDSDGDIDTEIGIMD